MHGENENREFGNLMRTSLRRSKPSGPFSEMSTTMMSRFGRGKV